MKVTDKKVWKELEMLAELEHFVCWMNHHLLKWNLPDGWKGGELDEQNRSDNSRIKSEEKKDV